jgi:hypothetical protein
MSIINAPLTIASVNTTSNELTVAAPHGLVTGDPFLVVYSPNGTLPAPLAPVTHYWAIVTGASTLKLAVSSTDAMAGTAIDLTTSGSGTLQLLRGMPYSIPAILVPFTQLNPDHIQSVFESIEALWALRTGSVQTVWSTATFLTGAITPPTITNSGVDDAYAPTGLATASVVRQAVSGTNIPTIGGITGGVEGRVLWIVCLGATSGDRLALAHEDTPAAAGDRIKLPGSTGLTILQNGAVCLRYDGTSQRWFVIAKSS